VLRVPGSGWSGHAGGGDGRRTSSSTPETEYAACWALMTSSSNYSTSQYAPDRTQLIGRTTGTQMFFVASYSISLPSSVSRRQVPLSREKYIVSSKPGGAGLGVIPAVAGGGIPG
jgi:hypothetical protein